MTSFMLTHLQLNDLAKTLALLLRSFNMQRRARIEKILARVDEKTFQKSTYGFMILGYFLFY